MSVRVPLSAGALVALALLAAACGREAPKAAALRPVLTERVGAVAALNAPVYAGEVRSRIEQPLAFRIAGKISERLVDAGAVVKAGQVLARLDPADAALAADAAEAQRRLADADLRRYRELREKNFVSQAALDSRETSLKASAAQADLARNQSAYTVLRADQPGVVGQVVAAGQPVFRIARLDTPEVAIAIPENRLPEVRRATRVEVSLWADAARTYPARLREIAAVADSATRTYAARVAILEPDAAVTLGMSASVRFRTGEAEERLAIPQAALFQKDGRPAVWVVADDATVSVRAVDVVRYTDDAVELAAGLQRGERIVVAGVHKLAEGEKIRVAERNGALAAAPGAVTR